MNTSKCQSENHVEKVLNQSKATNQRFFERLHNDLTHHWANVDF